MEYKESELFKFLKCTKCAFQFDETGIKCRKFLQGTGVVRDVDKTGCGYIKKK